MRYIHCLITQISTFGAVLVTGMGVSYITEGYGLHPILAGSVATLLFIGPHLIPLFERDENLL